MHKIFYFKSEDPAYTYGIDTFLNNLIGAIAATGRFQIYIIHLFDSTVEELTISKDNQKCIQIRVPAPLYYIKSHNNDQRYANRVVDLITPHFENSRPIIHINSYIESDIAKIVKEKFNFPILLTVHDLLIQSVFIGNRIQINKHIEEKRRKSKIYITNKEAALCQISDYILTVTDEQKKIISGCYDIDSHKIEVIRRGLLLKNEIKLNGDKAALRKRFFLGTSEKIIIYAGRINRSKDLKGLIEAFKTLIKEDADYRLLLVGDGEFDTISGCIGDFWSKINHIPFISQEDLMLLYKISDIGILPHLYDNDSFIAKEMACNGLPIILSDCLGFKELFTDRMDCLMVPIIVSSNGSANIDMENLVESIKVLFHNKQIAEAMTKKCTYTIVTKNQFQDTAKVYENLYLKVLK